MKVHMDIQIHYNLWSKKVINNVIINSFFYFLLLGLTSFVASKNPVPRNVVSGHEGRGNIGSESVN